MLCPTQDKAVEVVDTPQQRDGRESTAGKSVSLSDQYQPLTETKVSLTTVCVVSAVTRAIFYLHTNTHTQACFSLFLSLVLTHFIAAQIHIMDTHTHILTQTNLARKVHHKLEF